MASCVAVAQGGGREGRKRQAGKGCHASSAKLATLSAFRSHGALMHSALGPRRVRVHATYQAVFAVHGALGQHQFDGSPSPRDTPALNIEFS